VEDGSAAEIAIADSFCMTEGFEHHILDELNQTLVLLVALGGISKVEKKVSGVTGPAGL